MKENQSGIFKTAIGFTLFGILVILIGIFSQISKINDAKKIELTYRIYEKMEKWEKEHPEAEEWIYNIDDTTSLARNYEKWDFETYVGYFEDVYSLWQKDLIDKQFSYDLFSWVDESIYERNNAELKKIILADRKKQNDPEIYLGVEFLYYEFIKKRKTLMGTHKIVPKD